MGVIQRGSTFEARVTWKGVRKSKSFKSKHDADAWYFSARQSLIKGMDVPVAQGSVTTNATTLSSALHRAYLKYWKDQFSDLLIGYSAKQMSDEGNKLIEGLRSQYGSK